MTKKIKISTAKSKLSYDPITLDFPKGNSARETTRRNPPSKDKTIHSQKNEAEGKYD